MRDELVLETVEQIRALAHPLRQRILDLLADAPSTNKQLANALHVSPPRLHFHMKELQAAGLIEIVAEKPKGGVIEKYYGPTARVFRLGPEARGAAKETRLTETTLEAIRQDYGRAHDYFHGRFPHLNFAHEPVRLSQERLERIQQHLQEIHDEMYEAISDPRREEYELLISLSYILHDLPPQSSSGTEEE